MTPISDQEDTEPLPDYSTLPVSLTPKCSATRQICMSEIVSTTGQPIFRTLEWVCGILSVVPPIMFIGSIQQSEWTKSDGLFTLIIGWSVVVGSAMGLISRSSRRWRLLTALVCPPLAATLAASLGTAYELINSPQLPPSISGLFFYTVVFALFTSPSIAAFLVAHTM